MRIRTRRARFLYVMALGAGFWLALAPPAHAYIDPGTGSYVFQILIAAVVGAAFSIKLFWRRIKGFFTGKRPPEPPLEQTPDRT
jgi:hypothetical protein